MRIVLDLQALQTPSRFRGVGRYVMGLTQGIIRNRGNHEIFLMVNGSLAESAQAIEHAFAGQLPPENIIKWYSPLPLKYFEPDGPEHQEVGGILQCYKILDLHPDMVVYGTLLADFAEDIACNFSILKKYTRLAIVIYDFLPYQNPDLYLGGIHSQLYAHYMDVFNQLQYIDLFLPISNYVKKDLQAIISHGEAKTIFSDTDAQFRSISTTDDERKKFLTKFQINDNFILYTGGNDERKNVPTLLEAYQNLPDILKEQHQLVVVEGKNSTSYDSRYTQDKYIHFLGYISDNYLVLLYNYCKLFVFPSLEEGFGLTPLEAMRCGAAVIASNTTSLPEVIGLEEAQFDPCDVAQLTKKMQQVLSDPVFHARLREHGKEQQRLFSWNLSARLCLDAMEKLSPLPQKEDFPDGFLSAREALRALTLTKEKHQLACSCLEKTFSSRAGCLS